MILCKTKIDGTPCAVKVACTVWSGGKAGDNFKGLPIAINDVCRLLEETLAKKANRKQELVTLCDSCDDQCLENAVKEGCVITGNFINSAGKTVVIIERS